MFCQPAVIERASWLKEFVRLASDSRAAPNRIPAHFDGKIYAYWHSLKEVIKCVTHRRLSPEMYSLQTAGFREARS